MHTQYVIVGCNRQFRRSDTSPNWETKWKQWYLHSDTWIFINWIWIATRFRDCQLWGTGSGNSAILAPKSSDQENREKPTFLWKKSRRQFSDAVRCFVPKTFNYQTTSVWFVTNEYLMGKTDVYRSLRPCYRVVGWDIKNDVTSKFKCKFYKQLGSPNLATIAKFDEIVKIRGCILLSNAHLTPDYCNQWRKLQKVTHSG